MATILDIANKAGVAKSTVSRTLRNDPSLSIKDETRERILQVAQEMNYDKKLKSKSNGVNIVIIHKDTHFINPIDNAYYFSVRDGIEDICQKKDIGFTFVSISFIEKFNQDIDGAILVGNFGKYDVDKVLSHIKTTNLVCVSNINFYTETIDWVTYDIKDSVHKGVDYLLDKNHKKIAYIGGQDISDMPINMTKLHHFKKYLSSMNMLDENLIIETEHGVENGYITMKQWLLNNNNLPDAIFVSNDPIALGVLKALNESKIDVPKDISIISINGDSSSAFSYPALTTVNVHTQVLGKEAVLALSERIKGYREITKKVVYKTHIVERDSVGLSEKLLSL